MEAPSAPDDLTPAAIVAELDKYIVGQKEAKKAVAIALRNRTRRRLVPGELRDEIAPKNIILIGATGVGKTEIARRLARLTGSPFLKVEATKFTEVGYVGRDVESIIRDLTGVAVSREKTRLRDQAKDEIARLAEERLLDALLPAAPKSAAPPDPALREAARLRLRAGEFEEKFVEIDQGPRAQVKNAMIGFVPGQGTEGMDELIQNLVGQVSAGTRRRRRLKVREARLRLEEQAAERLIDNDKVSARAIEAVEGSGIVFIDEIDKVAAAEGGRGHGPDISREGVQRDLLPLVEGCTVQTRWGLVKTDHVLFIASGAFHTSRPGDLIPELQGRFPIRVELSALTAEDLEKILTQPKNALLAQYRALLATEGVALSFTPDAVAEIARTAYEINQGGHNIGARRLATVMERLLEDVLFRAPDTAPEVAIDAAFVREKLEPIRGARDLSRDIL
ncbi:MAG: ATP-dependent protease ATPase subunit HslU [Spirochaetes bacterium]|nr:ATP-dependent protease ATPase subunit HslU [Spirochaetota bacterium]